MNFEILLLLTSLLACVAAGADQANFAKDAILLSNDHSWMRENPASDYWNLSSYYVEQETGASCSVAAILPIANAYKKRLDTQQILGKLWTHEKWLAAVDNPDWSEAVRDGGPGLAMSVYAEFLEEAFKKTGLGAVSIEQFVLKSDSKEEVDRIRNLLIENEKSDLDFIIGDFDQSHFLPGDEAGHFSPVGAYDSKRDRVLIMDVDRDDAEPYWIPFSLFIKAITPVADGPQRGLIHLKLR